MSQLKPTDINRLSNPSHSDHFNAHKVCFKSKKALISNPCNSNQFYRKSKPFWINLFRNEELKLFVKSMQFHKDKRNSNANKSILMKSNEFAISFKTMITKENRSTKSKLSRNLDFSALKFH